MRVERITTLEDFRKIRNQWNSLLRSSEDNSIFYTHEWFCSWWKSFSFGKSLETLLFKDKQGELLGIAPLMSEGNKLRFIASQEVTDYCDFVVRKGKAEEFYPQLLDYLETHYSNVEKIELINIKSTSLTLASLPRTAHKYGYSCLQSKAEVAPFLDLPPTYEEFLSLLSRKNRHELRRKLRRINNLEGVKIAKIINPPGSQTAIKAFIDLHKQSEPSKKKFWEKEGMVDFFREITLQFSEKKWLALLFLCHDEKIMASLLNFSYNDQVHFYNVAYNRDYSWYSPGLFLFDRSIKQAISENKRKADFLRGRERYKYYFGTKESRILSLTLNQGVKTG